MMVTCSFQSLDGRILDQIIHMQVSKLCQRRINYQQMTLNYEILFELSENNKCIIDNTDIAVISP